MPFRLGSVQSVETTPRSAKRTPKFCGPYPGRVVPRMDLYSSAALSKRIVYCSPIRFLKPEASTGRQTRSPFLAFASPIRITSEPAFLSVTSFSWRRGVRGFTLPTTASPFCCVLAVLLLQPNVLTKRLRNIRYFIILGDTFAGSKGNCIAAEI